MEKPNCLHIPTHYEDERAQIMWGPVEGANCYQLDCVYDESFERASTGRSWAALKAAEQNWTQFEGRQLGWESFEALSAQGLMWRNIAFEDLDWAQFEGSDHTWGELTTLPVRFTVYEGGGTPAYPPDLGQSWEMLHASGYPWGVLDNSGHSWGEIELLFHNGPTWRDAQGYDLAWSGVESSNLTWGEIGELMKNGLTWEGMNARQLAWVEVEAKELDWGGIEQLPPDHDEHPSCMVDVLPYASEATYRVRAANETAYSGYLTAAPVPILPLFYREDEITLEVIAGREYQLQLSARGVQEFRDLVMTLKYQPHMLRLERFRSELPASKADDHGADPVSNVGKVYKGEGEVQFICTKPMRAAKQWSGPVVLVSFTALGTGATSLTLH